MVDMYDELGCCILDCFWTFIPKQTSYNHCLSSLSATRVTTMFYNNQLVFAVIYHSLAKECPWAEPPVASKSNPDGTQDSDIEN